MKMITKKDEDDTTVKDWIKKKQKIRQIRRRTMKRMTTRTNMRNVPTEVKLTTRRGTGQRR